MNHLHRELAPISEGVWEILEHEAKTRLTTHLAARRVVDFVGPSGWSHSATNLGRTEEIAAPSEGVSAARRRVQPLVEFRAEFHVSRIDLDDAERGAADLDLAELDEAARQISIGENVTVFHGFGAGGIRGITESTSHEPLELTDETAQYPTVVARGTDTLRKAGIDGPYALVLSPELFTRIVETTEHGGVLLFDHLAQILGGPLVWGPGVDGGVLLSLRGGDFRLECGQDLSIGFLDTTPEVVTLYLEESLTFTVLEPDAALALRLAP
jgi:uncharacterized linocin/CFP29 family protein